MWQFVTGNELYHHGILGMKWGVRRWQYKDGSLTPAGKKRAAKLAKKYRETTGSDVSTATKTKRRIEDMTNEELIARTDRLNYETRYLDAIESRYGRNKKKKGESYAKKFFWSTLLPTATKTAGTVITEKMKSSSP